MARQKVKFLFIIMLIVVIAVVYNFISSQATVYDTNFKNLKIHKNKITLYDERGEKIHTYTLKESIKAYSIGDIDGDDKDELVLLTGRRFSKYGKNVVIFSLKGKIVEIYREDFSKLNPWKIVLGDIDGDGSCEISVGVYKKTPFHQVMAKRPFIYSYEDNVLRPKWRGSRLSKPFTDYDFCDIDGDGVDEILAIEVLENKEKVINTYKWEGFGFQGFLQSQSFRDIRRLKTVDGLAYVEIKDKEGWYLGKVKIEGNNIKVER